MPGTDDYTGIKAKVDSLLERLSVFYWSRHEPEKYVIKHPQTGRNVGLGVIARQNYAAFNLTVAFMRGSINSITDQNNACNVFGAIKHSLEAWDKDEKISGYITLLSLDEFSEWFKQERHTIPEDLCIWIGNAIKHSTTESLHKIR